MKKYTLYSWNVNGIRAVSGKEVLPGISFPQFLIHEKPDILCLQETKADSHTLPPEITRIPGYFFYINPAIRKGYSGVAMYSRTEPVSIERGGLSPEFDTEGRIIIARYPEFVLLNVYFPNGGASDERLAFKLRFYDAFLEKIKAMQAAGERIIFCGDVNTAHKPIDLARPKENEQVSGFLPVEREWIDRVIDAGFFDSFRLFSDEPEQYSWWDYKTRARARNVGWRIDYFFVNAAVRPFITGAGIRNDIMGSDHCPVTLTVEFP
ncbi:MAG TPA: exodeoxyribonuclease III [Methanospirillum sp.]|uniref:exodeoxyribonuclease III n=1 Tax=Methanospirillum sp. TaxID=45200 RepID=UPI002CE31548|nr:exodeoxyribonuclease III [Methanospirillum sp.]HOJ96732.1 exodeoxyribonuclease III [Methanospirillum sp.]HOL41429.1 exodeoxyribonuclease III [Methanospirillum sp.]